METESLIRLILILQGVTVVIVFVAAWTVLRSKEPESTDPYEPEPEKGPQGISEQATDAVQEILSDGPMLVSDLAQEVALRIGVGHDLARSLVHRVDGLEFKDGYLFRADE